MRSTLCHLLTNHKYVVGAFSGCARGCATAGPHRSGAAREYLTELGPGGCNFAMYKLPGVSEAQLIPPGGFREKQHAGLAPHCRKPTSRRGCHQRLPAATRHERDASLDHLDLQPDK